LVVKVRDIIKEMEILAPPLLMESYDNVGLMVGTEEKEVKKILLALDCTKEVIEEAKENNVDLIITHHPLIFRKPSRIIREDLQGWKIIELIKNDISLYSSHTNLDAVKGGINEELVNILGFKNSKLIENNSIEGYEDAGIGRIVEIEGEIIVENLIDLIKKKLGVKRLRAVIGDKEIKKIAVINGSGQDLFSRAVTLGADCIITGDTTYHFASDYKEMGVTIIDAGHFYTEWTIFLKIMQKNITMFKEIEFIQSKVSRDPYTFL
jgi:dinuclear metal center YbgI/SA1388 family protein